LGRFHDDKAFDVLIPALAQVPKAILWLGGEGPREADLRQQAEQLGVNDRIRWLGWRKDVAALAAAADVLCCPSRVEPLGNVVLEAWGYGLPVVAADSSGPAELITSGRNGILVPQENADSLAAALRRVLGDRGLAQELAQTAERDLAARFSKAAVVASYLEFFDRVGR
jgi:glycosyltransferase involved in cell wall biosynthesis